MGVGRGENNCDRRKKEKTARAKRALREVRKEKMGGRGG